MTVTDGTMTFGETDEDAGSAPLVGMILLLPPSLAKQSMTGREVRLGCKPWET